MSTAAKKIRMFWCKNVENRTSGTKLIRQDLIVLICRFSGSIRIQIYRLRATKITQWVGVLSTTTEKPQNQRKYDDRDETINFHSENVMYSHIHIHAHTHISGFTYSLCRRVTMTMPKKILSTQPAQLTHRCNSAFNASHLKFIILSGTIAFLSVAEIIFTHHSAAANKIRNNLAKLRLSFEKWQYSTCKIEMLYI